MPNEWKKRVIAPIYKTNRYIQDFINYGDAKLITQTIKLLVIVIEHWLMFNSRPQGTSFLLCLKDLQWKSFT